MRISTKRCPKTNKWQWKNAKHLNEDVSPIKKVLWLYTVVYWRVKGHGISSYFIHFLYFGSIFIPSKLLQKVVAGSGTTGTTTVGVTTTTTTAATSITTTASILEWISKILWEFWKMVTPTRVIYKNRWLRNWNVFVILGIWLEKKSGKKGFCWASEPEPFFPVNDVLS